MATLTFFNSWRGTQAKEANCATDTFKIMLTNSTPNVTTHTVKADLTEISATGGYTAKTLTTTFTEPVAGTYRLAANADQTWTASGGTMDTFRYAVLYDDTVASPVKPLVGYWDYGSGLSLASGDSFTLDLDANFALYTVA